MNSRSLMAPLLLALVIAAPPADAQQSTEDALAQQQLLMYTPASAEVRELRRLYQRAGRVLPVAGFPVSAPALRAMAEALAGELEAAAAERSAALHAELWARLRPELEQYLGRLADRTGLEGSDRPDESDRLTVRTRLGFEGRLATTTPEADLRRDHLERPPLGELLLAWSRPQQAGILAEAMLRREYSTDYSPWNLPDSRPANPIAAENRNISRGYLWYDFGPLELQFGRDKVHFGPLRSSLLPSESLPFMDMLRLTLPLGPLTMDLMISSLESRAASPADVTIVDPDDYGFGKTIILANLHRFEYDFGFLRAAVSGLCLYARPDNYFVLADFFPVFSWHSGDIKPNNLSLIFDLEAAPLPGLRAMLQFGFDDINAQGMGLGDSDIPTIPAVIGGLEYARGLRCGDLSLYGEGGYTHYLWGNFDNSTGEWALGRAIYRLALDKGTRVLPLTSPYGPGAIWAAAEAALESRRGLAARLFLELVFLNPAANLIDTPYAASDAVRDTPREGRHRFGMELRYRPWSWLQLAAQPALHVDGGEAWFVTSLGLSATLQGRWAVSRGQR